MKELSSFQKEFCSAAGELAMKLSFARSVGQVFGLLYIHSDPLALDDISVLLKMSKGSVSINLRRPGVITRAIPFQVPGPNGSCVRQSHCP